MDIRASAVNRADLSQARGNYPPPPGASPILGLEMAGVIRALGRDVTGWRVGDRVCALLPGGGYAEQAVVPAGMLMPIPDDWDFNAAAAIPEVWFTAYVNLFLEGRLRPGERALIHAGASGVGTAAIQLAVATGATAYVTASAAKHAACLDLGAVLAIDYKQDDFADFLLRHVDGVDVILDPVGGPYTHRNLRILRRYGRLIAIGLLGGGAGEINMADVLRKRLTVIGSTLRTRPVAEKIAITRGFTRRFWPLLADGTLKPVIDTVFPMQEAHAAHAYVAANRNVGKVILALSDQ